MNENLPKDFEDALRRELRPLDAPDGFTARLMDAIAAEDAAARPTPTRTVAAPVVARTGARPFARQFGMPAALAASLLVAVLFGQHHAEVRAQREERRQGLAASRELMQALRVTSQKLDLAYEAVNKPPTAGDEENRS